MSSANINNINSGEWKEVKLGDYINIKHGYAFKGKYITDQETENILVTPGNFCIGGGFKTTKFKYFDNEIPSDYILQTGDLVVTMTDLSKESDTLGYSAKIPNMKDKIFLHNQRIGLVEFHNKNVDEEYIYWLLRTSDYHWYIVSSASGTSIMHTSPSRIMSYSFLLPPLSEQKAIAEVLSGFDDKIDLLHRQNKTLEQMAETLFRQCFIEEAKEDWEEVKVKEFDAIVTDYVANGSFASLAENVNYSKTVGYARLIRLTDYNNNYKEDGVYVDEKAYTFLSKSKLNAGDIIISNVGVYAGTVFKCPNLKIPMTLGPNSIVIKSSFNNYFYLLFKSQYGKHLLDGIISGSAQPKFNKTAFRNLELTFPSLDRLQEFEENVNHYFNKIENNQTQIRALEGMRDSLLPKLMSGEVRVI